MGICCGKKARIHDHSSVSTNPKYGHNDEIPKSIGFIDDDLSEPEKRKDVKDEEEKGSNGRSTVGDRPSGGFKVNGPATARVQEIKPTVIKVEMMKLSPSEKKLFEKIKECYQASGEPNKTIDETVTLIFDKITKRAKEEETQLKKLPEVLDAIKAIFEKTEAPNWSQEFDEFRAEIEKRAQDFTTPALSFLENFQKGLYEEKVKLSSELFEFSCQTMVAKSHISVLLDLEKIEAFVHELNSQEKPLKLQIDGCLKLFID